MKPFNLKTLTCLLMAVLSLSIFVTSCSKSHSSDDAPGGENNSTPHNVDQQAVGEWLWTDGSDNVYYDDNGVYHGSDYGFATKLTIKPNGSGTCYNHIFSNLYGSTLAVDISYSGYFETDNQGSLNFYPTGGTYKNNNGVNRKLRSDELYNASTGANLYTYPGVNFTNIGGRNCFTLSYSDGSTEVFYKL